MYNISPRGRGEGGEQWIRGGVLLFGPRCPRRLVVCSLLLCMDETGLPTVKCPKSRLVPWPEALAGPRPFDCDGRWACGNKRGTRWWYYFFRDKYGAPHKPCKIWEAKETSLKYSFVRQHGPIFVGPPGYGLRMPTFGPPADCVPMPKLA